MLELNDDLFKIVINALKIQQLALTSKEPNWYQNAIIQLDKEKKEFKKAYKNKSIVKKNVNKKIP